MMPVPRNDESQAAFVSRAHEELSGEFPDTDQRNAVIFKQWRDHRGNSDLVERKAREKFGNSKKFVRVPDVCVFTEHETKDADGNRVVYDRKALEKIAARCNHRFLDTGDSAPVTLGHTPTEEQIATGAPMPEIGGYAANFRIGMIGNKKPRYAIFADEYRYVDTAPLMEKRPRRSVELWTEERMEDRFFDPIAALGAETPRLDLGMAYAKRPGPSGKCVAKYAAKYTMGVACAPGAASVSPKKWGDDEKHKKRHASEGNGAPPAQPAGAPNPQSGGGATLTPEDCQMIVGAVEELPWVKWVKEKMESEGHGSPSGSPSHSPSGIPSESPSGHSPSGTPSHYAAGSPSGKPSESPSGSPSKYGADTDPSGGAMGGQAESGLPSNPSKNSRRPYAAGSLEGSLATTGGQTIEGKPVNSGNGTVADPQLMKLARRTDRKDRYRRLEARLEKVEKENGKLRNERAAALRFSRLSDLRAQGFVFEIAEELEDTASFSDEQFDRHCKRIPQRYQKAVVGNDFLPTPRVSDAKPDKYEKALGDRVKEIHARNVKANKHVDYAEVVALAEADLQKSGIQKTA